MSEITVVGAGYVGSVTTACLAAAGHTVTCVDANPDRVEAIRRGHSPVAEPGLSALLRESLSAGRLRATTDVVEAVAASQMTMIAVGTPIAGTEMDLTMLTKACERIGLGLREQTAYHVVVVRSTVVPGTTETLVRERVLQASGRPEGTVGFCMNPEFLREGSALDDARHPDRIVIGQWDARSGDALAAVYPLSPCPIIRTTLRNAELIKCASNTLLATLISFSNELAALCERLPGTDVDEVLRVLHVDRRWSPVVEGRRISPEILSYLRAGCGFGGSCLPKDLQALSAFARQQGVTPRLLEAVVAVNHQRPSQLVKLLEGALRSFDGTTVAVLGLAFKPGTDDLRASPALAVIEHLLRVGAAVKAYDPVAGPSAQIDARVQICQTAEECCTDADAVMLVTAWPEFQQLDWASLCRRMRRPVILDGRNLLRSVRLPAGVTYLPVGQAASAVVSDAEAVAR